MLKENKLQSKMNDTNFFVTLTFKHTQGFCLKEIQEKKTINFSVIEEFLTKNTYKIPII